MLDNWENLDVAALDTDDLFTRFVNLKGKTFTPQSLGTYKSRFNKAVSEFLIYAKDPSAWKPKASSSSSPRREKATNGNGSKTTAPATTPPDTETPTLVTPTSRTGLVEYPFPLRERRFAYLRLPADLTAADVKRLTASLTTLTLEDVA